MQCELQHIGGFTGAETDGEGSPETVILLIEGDKVFLGPLESNSWPSLLSGAFIWQLTHTSS